VSAFANLSKEPSRYARFLAEEVLGDPEHRFYSYWLAVQWAVYQLVRGFIASRETDDDDVNQRAARQQATKLFRADNTAKFNEWLNVEG